MKYKQLGFTLIELLVVISIIGMLAAIVLVSLNSARGKARDSRRQADRKQVHTALNLYYNDNGSWPSTAGAWKCLAPTSELCWANSYSGSDALITALQPYMASFPTNNATSGTYAYNRILYTSFIAAGGLGTGSPAGAYLIWAMENTMPASMCNSTRPPDHYDAYWYCYEFIGQ